MDGAFAADAWCTAVPDWKDRIQAGESLLPDLPLHDAEAERALAIFCNLRIPDLTGQPRFGDVARPWVLDLVRAIFGAIDPETRARMIREYFVMIPKKNTKTTISAGIVVTACLMNQVPFHTFILVASSINVANNAFKQVKNIIAVSETPSGTRLESLFHVRDHQRSVSLLYKACPSEIAIKAADTDIVTGFMNGSALIDELHELSAKPKAEGILLEIVGAMANPENRGFVLTITTQSKKPPSGAFRNMLQVARSVRDGKTRLPLLPLIYEMPPELSDKDGWRNPALWGLVNPNMGASVSESFLRDEYQKATEKGIEALALFASQHLNVEIGASLHGESWSGAAFWVQSRDEGLTDLAALMRRSEVCTIGADWGGADDLAALYVIGREAGTRRWLGWGRAWARQKVLQVRREIVPQLTDFMRQGDLILAPDAETQAAMAAEICDQVFQSGLLPEKSGIGLDVAGIALLIDALEDRGMTQPLVTAVPQTWKLQQATQTVALKLEDGRFLHGGQPIMAWAVGNAKQELQGSTYVVRKSVAGSAKIDPLAALFDAAALMVLNPVASGSGAFVYQGM